jgi:hypothetical protein
MQSETEGSIVINDKNLKEECAGLKEEPMQRSKVGLFLVCVRSNKEDIVVEIDVSYTFNMKCLPQAHVLNA